MRLWLVANQVISLWNVRKWWGMFLLFGLLLWANFNDILRFLF